MESTTFVSKGSNRYSLHLTPERKGFNPIGEIEVIPAKLVAFEGGVFKTEDPEEAEKIRNSDAFKKGRIFELKIGEEPPAPSKAQVVRGSISSATLKGEMGSEPTEEKSQIKLAEQGTTYCAKCDKYFQEDFHGRKLRMHTLRKHGDPKKKTKKVKEK